MLFITIPEITVGQLTSLVFLSALPCLSFRRNTVEQKRASAVGTIAAVDRLSLSLPGLQRGFESDMEKNFSDDIPPLFIGRRSHRWVNRQGTRQ
jgi:hypothetical protein